METEYSINDFNILIGKMKYYKSRISYSGNSIYIEFYTENDKRLNFL